MSQITRHGGSGQRRTQICKAAAITIRELAMKPSVDAEARDMASFVSLCLTQIHNTIEDTVKAWEKRNYWVKADRFRREWHWAEKNSRDVAQAVMSDDWDKLTLLMPEIAAQFNNVKLPKRNTIGTAWNGAYQHLRKSNRK